MPRFSFLPSPTRKVSFKETTEVPAQTSSVAKPGSNAEQAAGASRSKQFLRNADKTWRAKLSSLFKISGRNLPLGKMAKTSKDRPKGAALIHKRATPAIVYGNLERNLGMDSKAFSTLAEEIKTLQGHMQKKRKIPKDVRMQFNSTYQLAFGELKFNAEEVQKLGELRDYIVRKHHSESTPVMIETPRNKSDSTVPTGRPPVQAAAAAIKPAIRKIGESNTLFDNFLGLLSEVPRQLPESESANVEPHDFRYQYATVDNSIGAAAVVSGRQVAITPQEYGEIIPNAGGGDCIFHALAGRNLIRKEIEKLRADIALMTENSDAVSSAYYAQMLVAGLSQTPEYSNRTNEFMNGRHSISRAVYAAFQRIPQTYAGEYELMQWTRLHRNKDTTVVMIDADGTLAQFNNGIRQELAASELDTHLATANVVLYKTMSHWQRLIPSSKSQPDTQAQDPRSRMGKYAVRFRSPLTSPDQSPRLSPKRTTSRASPSS